MEARIHDNCDVAPFVRQPQFNERYSPRTLLLCCAAIPEILIFKLLELYTCFPPLECASILR